MKVKKLIICFLALFLIVGCTKKANIEITSYEDVIKKLDNDESFVFALINDKDESYKSFNNNLKKIVKDYNINIIYLNINKLSSEQIDKIKLVINYSSTPTLAFINNGIEENSNNRIIGDISVDRMIEIFKTAGYID